MSLFYRYYPGDRLYFGGGGGGCCCWLASNGVDRGG